MSFWEDFLKLIFSSSTEFSQQVLELPFHTKREFSRVFLLSFSKEIFLSVLLLIYLVFSYKAELSFLYLSYKIFCLWEWFYMWSRSWSPSVLPLYSRSLRLWPQRACGFACILFLQEQVRDLRVQELLRKLIGIAVPSDLAGSIVVKILHCGEGGDVKQVV